MPALVITPERSLILRVLKTNKPMNNAYATATAAASVGVNIPPSIPPNMITGVNSGKKAFILACPRSGHEYLFVAQENHIYLP